MKLLLGPLLAVVVALAPNAVAGQASASQPEDGHHAAKGNAPARAEWLADVRAATTGSGTYVRQRVATQTSDEMFAVNFDIDNTVIATYYDGGGAIPRMLRFAKLLDRLGVAVAFNTGRLAGQRQRTVRQLTRAGFPVDQLCLRGPGRTLAFGKQRCRDLFAARGYTLIANVGNNDTDFVGDGFERAYRLPDYGVLG